ncbi:MAG: 1,4-alpha-glucan branching protein GlgB [Bacteroidota bacterium]
MEAPGKVSVTGTHFSLFTEYDIELFKAGRQYRLYERFGAHLVTHNGVQGVYFAVWAPNAKYVSVIGNFNCWDRHSHHMHVRWDSTGIWELFVPFLGNAEYYKYYIEANSGYSVEKGDPYATHWETAPNTSSIVWHRNMEWTDDKWMKERKEKNWQQQPISVYEVHLGSWRRKEEDGRFLTYREMAAELPAYCRYMGFTHVELMPVMEHPFYGSWGYQITGYFAPSSRFGTPQDFAFLINELHCAGIGVILDWVPSHFPDDEHGLSYFDGTQLYEHPDPTKGFHPDWKSYIFNYSRNEVKAFLISNALYWLDQYHIDGLRVDAVASMLYLDYSRNHGEWSPNEYGGRENLESMRFLIEFNDAVHAHHSDTITIAEESSSWPGVTRPTAYGGLGFDMKWMMGWMHDTLQYFAYDPVYRSYHQNNLTFNIYYAFSEKFTLPLSHDEVVYGKRSLINKMPGDSWQQFANLRLLYGYMYGHPGAKLIFMGGEFAQRHEWRHDFSLDWDENNNPSHNGIQRFVKDLNELYKSKPAWHQYNFSPQGFEWIDFDDTSNCVISWLRKGNDNEFLVFICNFTPVVRENYRVGVPERGYYKELLNSDWSGYGGSNVYNYGQVETAPIPRHGKAHSMSLTLPPLAMLVLEWNGDNL